jgi:hypothetical protein
MHGSEPDAEIEPADTDSEPHPRAFVTATGFALQGAGLVFLAVAAVYWLISGRVQKLADGRIDRLADYFATPNLGLTAITGLVLAAVCGGLAMITFGLGMQGEMRRSGIGAMVVAGAMTLIGVAAAAVFLAAGPDWMGSGVAAAWTLVSGILFLLAGNSTSILRRFPPPKDQNVVDDAWIQEYHRKRRESRDII